MNVTARHRDSNYFDYHFIGGLKASHGCSLRRMDFIFVKLPFGNGDLMKACSKGYKKTIEIFSTPFGYNLLMKNRFICCDTSLRGRAHSSRIDFKGKTVGPS